jgi:hypothetical protein
MVHYPDHGPRALIHLAVMEIRRTSRLMGARGTKAMLDHVYGIPRWHS